LNRFLARPLGAAFVALALAACSSAEAPPQSEPSAASAEALLLPPHCPAFTTPVYTCSLRCRYQCTPVTGAPTGSWPSAPAASPIDPPVSLDGMECTTGLSIPSLQEGGAAFTANVWACAAYSSRSTLETVPQCIYDTSGPTNMPCEDSVTSGATLNDNPYVGAADSGWTLVVQSVTTGMFTYSGTGGCNTGCLQVTKQ
jgi:hypothetical protein